MLDEDTATIIEQIFAVNERIDTSQRGAEWGDLRCRVGFIDRSCHDSDKQNKNDSYLNIRNPGRQALVSSLRPNLGIHPTTS